MSSTYRAFGLLIQSDFPLPELTPQEGEPDVFIRLGEVPDQLPDGQTVDAYHQAARDQVLLVVDGVGRYLVDGGRQILVQPFAGYLESDLRLFLLGSCIGALLQQRDTLALHASAIVGPAGAILFAGPSGSGKSTLLAAFLERDYLMLADDVTVVQSDAGQRPQAVPGLSRMKLWADAAKTMGLAQSALNPLRPGAMKYGVMMPRRFAPLPVPVDRIYVLAPGLTPEISIEPVGSLGRLQALLDNTYREDLMHSSRRPIHLQQISTLAAEVSLYQVSRPTEVMTEPRRLADYLEQEWLAARS